MGYGAGRLYSIRGVIFWLIFKFLAESMTYLKKILSAAHYLPPTLKKCDVYDLTTAYLEVIDPVSYSLTNCFKPKQRLFSTRINLVCICLHTIFFKRREHVSLTFCVNFNTWLAEELLARQQQCSATAITFPKTFLFTWHVISKMRQYRNKPFFYS